MANGDAEPCMIKEEDSVNLTCTALGYPAYSQIRLVSAEDVFQPIVVNSTANMSHIGSFVAGTLINEHQTSLPVGKHILVCEVGFLVPSDKPTTSVVDSSSLPCTVIAGMLMK